MRRPVHWCRFSAISSASKYWANCWAYQKSWSHWSLIPALCPSILWRHLQCIRGNCILVRIHVPVCERINSMNVLTDIFYHYSGCDNTSEGNSNAIVSLHSGQHCVTQWDWKSLCTRDISWIAGTHWISSSIHIRLFVHNRYISGGLQFAQRYNILREHPMHIVSWLWQDTMHCSSRSITIVTFVFIVYFQASLYLQASWHRYHLRSHQLKITASQIHITTISGFCLFNV